MKRRIVVLTTTVVLAASGVASAAISHPNNNGHPSTNPSGNCPAGQNKGDTPGALHKC